MYDDARDLLYVGVTTDLNRRLREHRRTKPWYWQVARVTAAEFATIDEARVAEERAIASERPSRNVHHNYGGSAPLTVWETEESVRLRIREAETNLVRLAVELSVVNAAIAAAHRAGLSVVDVTVEQAMSAAKTA